MIIELAIIVAGVNPAVSLWNDVNMYLIVLFYKNIKTELYKFHKHSNVNYFRGAYCVLLVFQRSKDCKWVFF